MIDTSPMHKHEFRCGFKVTMEELEDSDLTELLKEIDRRSIATKLHLTGELVKQVTPPKARVGRFRLWLGWKLWDCAVMINPGVRYS